MAVRESSSSERKVNETVPRRRYHVAFDCGHAICVLLVVKCMRKRYARYHAILEHGVYRAYRLGLYTIA